MEISKGDDFPNLLASTFVKECRYMYSWIRYELKPAEFGIILEYLGQITFELPFRVARKISGKQLSYKSDVKEVVIFR